jgi:hypothetical protein
VYARTLGERQRKEAAVHGRWKRKIINRRSIMIGLGGIKLRGKKLTIPLIIVLVLSLGFNIYQYNKDRTSKAFYDTKFKSDFSSSVKNFGISNDTTLTTELAIKNSAVSIASLRSIFPLTSYKNEKLAELLLRLEMYLVLEPNKNVEKNIVEIRKFLTEINKDLNNTNLIIDFNSYIQKIASRQ